MVSINIYYILSTQESLILNKLPKTSKNYESYLEQKSCSHKIRVSSKKKLFYLKNDKFDSITQHEMTQ